MSEYLLGYDIGGTKCAVILGRSAGADIAILERRAFPTRVELGPEQALRQLEEIARQLLTDHQVPAASVRGLGVSCGGPLDSARGVILGPANLPGWDEIYITRRMEETLGIPTRLLNDANACALAEWKWGAGRGCYHLIFLTFGTGMGAGLILNGRLYVGANELAGEVGHIRLARRGPVGYGKAGSFEGFCSGSGIARLARQTILRCWQQGGTVGFCLPGELYNVTAQTVADAARAGDEVALEIFRTVARYLGRGFAILIDTLNPEVIVLGSIFLRAHDLLWPLAEKEIAAETVPLMRAVCRIVPAGLGEALGDYAALSVAAGEE